MNIMLGCDPEAFLVDVNGILRSSIGKIGGSKESPAPLPLGNGYAVQEDNVALEFNIPPASSEGEFLFSINRTLGFLGDIVDGSYGYKISQLSAASFPEEELQDPAALEFGCDPDYNAWTGHRNPRPSAEDKSLRSCGGHVHIGYDREKVSGEEIIKHMDLFCGVPSVLMDTGELRKQLYGKAGAFRYKPYGVEYRTLSNFWIFNDERIKWVWRNTNRAVDAAVAQPEISKGDQDLIINTINSNDKASAKQLVKKYNLDVI